MLIQPLMTVQGFREITESRLLTGDDATSVNWWLRLTISPDRTQRLLHLGEKLEPQRSPPTVFLKGYCSVVLAKCWSSLPNTFYSPINNGGAQWKSRGPNETSRAPSSAKLSHASHINLVTLKSSCKPSPAGLCYLTAELDNRVISHLPYVLNKT